MMSYTQGSSRETRAANGSQKTSGSTTTTVTSTPEPESSGTLRLRGEAAQSESTPQRRVQWAEDVVNNEGMGKKSSKVCCIYHKPRPVGESSDEESSDDSSSDDSNDFSDDDGAAKPASGRKHINHAHDHHNHPNQDCKRSSKAEMPNGKRRINAYEKVPKNT